MIAAGKEEIGEWFVKGAEKGRKYMLVVCDRMELPDEADSPYYTDSDDGALSICRAVRSDPFCTVMELCDLTADRDEQLSERRAWRLPGLSDTDDESEYEQNELLENLDKIRITKMGLERIRKNLRLENEDPLVRCIDAIRQAHTIIRRGKNWYVHAEDCVITVNASSYTIITAHKHREI